MEKAAANDGFFESRTWVACGKINDEESIFGFVSIHQAELTWCYVDPSVHGRGIGRKLVEYALPKMGVDGFVLVTSEKAVLFYQKCGFQVAARFPGEVQGRSCEFKRLALPTSKHRHRPPTPTREALRLAGYTDELPGKACLGEDGIYFWR